MEVLLPPKLPFKMDPFEDIDLQYMNGMISHLLKVALIYIPIYDNVSNLTHLTT